MGIASIREHAHCKIEDHLADELDQERDALMDTFKQKHKQEAKGVKAARRRLEAIRKAAHCKVEVHLTNDADALEDQLQKKKQDHAREAKRELKAHQRKFKAITSHAEPRVTAWLSEETEKGRDELAHVRAEKAKEQARQLQHSRKILKAHRAGSVEFSASDVQHHAALLLQAARRGSLARTIATPSAPPEQQSGLKHQAEAPSSGRARKAFADAKNNRLSKRRQAVVGDAINAPSAADGRPN